MTCSTSEGELPLRSEDAGPLPPRSVYLDHAATSFPKPPAVWNSVDRWNRSVGASAGRGAYREAREAARLLSETRARLCSLIGATAPERVIFTCNATAALNLAIKGIVRAGAHVIASDVEHNSVQRPLNALVERLGISVSRLPAFSTGEIDVEPLRGLFRRGTALVAIQHASNVSGAIQPIADIARIAREHGVPILVDAAQSAGSIPFDVAALGIDMVAMPGHKGLLGPQGTGALWVRPGLELATVVEGGTGSRSEQDVQPRDWPDRHEAGSHNMPGIAGLHAALRHIGERGLRRVRDRKIALVERLIDGLSTIPGIDIVGQRNAALNAGVVSIVPREEEPLAFAAALDERFGIKVRAGLHCAPGAHRAIGSFPAGTVRLSVGWSNVPDDIDRAVEGVAALAAAGLHAVSFCGGGVP